MHAGRHSRHGCVDELEPNTARRVGDKFAPTLHRRALVLESCAESHSNESCIDPSHQPLDARSISTFRFSQQRTWERHFLSWCGAAQPRYVSPLAQVDLHLVPTAGRAKWRNMDRSWASQTCESARRPAGGCRPLSLPLLAGRASMGGGHHHCALAQSIAA